MNPAAYIYALAFGFALVSLASKRRAQRLTEWQQWTQAEDARSAAAFYLAASLVLILLALTA